MATTPATLFSGRSGGFGGGVSARSLSIAGAPTRGGARGGRAGAAASRYGRMDTARAAELRKIALHYGQTLAWRARQDGYRIISVFAGSGGGKTYYGPRHFYPMFSAPGGLTKTYLFTEPTWRMLKRVMLP